MDRRAFLVTTGVGAVGLVAGIAACDAPRTAGIAPAPTEHKENKTMTIALPTLPYDVAALEPHLSKENLELHHGKHHNAYVVNLNKLVEEGKADGSSSLEQIIMAAPEGPVFNNAAQVWNHTFYWHCMKPGGGGLPSGALLDAINRDFGSFDKYKEQFTGAAVSQFGSGWAWLVAEGGKLEIVKTSNADLPMKHGQTALLTCDVWEHAYYPTHKNLRPKYVEVFLAKLVDWDFVAKNLAAA